MGRTTDGTLVLRHVSDATHLEVRVPVPGIDDLHYTSAIEILFVCTGNMCRSPMAEALMRRLIVERGIDVQVSSAGTVTDGRPAADETIEVMADRDLDITGHRSRKLDRELIAGSDLIIGMAREHLREAVLVDPASYGRTFTLKELVRRGNELGARTDDESIMEWLARMNDGRVPTAHLGTSDDDDVMDPMGMSYGVHNRVAGEISKLVDELAELMWNAGSARDQFESGVKW